MNIKHAIIKSRHYQIWMYIMVVRLVMTYKAYQTAKKSEQIELTKACVKQEY